MSNAYSVAVIGAGNMGSGIAQKMAQEGLIVTLVDMNEAAVERGLGIIRKMLDEGVARKVLTQEQMDATLARVKPTTSYDDVKDVDLIVEAIFEDLKIKGDLFEKLDGICNPKTIFATNTSSFYVRDLAARTKRPDRVVGMHYFFHPAKNRLLEVIPHEGVSEETMETALLIGKLHGKTNIVVADAPGFCVNRFFVPFLMLSIRALEEGIADIPTIEEAAKRAFKIGMGPFELMNVTGIPIALHAATTLKNELSDFYAPPQLLAAQVDSRELWNLEGNVDEAKIEEVSDYLLGGALGVACQLVDEKVASIEDTDRGAKIGLRWSLGPFELINRMGVDKIYACVDAICKRYPTFKMPQLLADQKAAGKPFEFNFVDLEVKGDVAYITVNRPEAMNALNPVVVDQLEACFNAAEEDEAVKAIAIQGAGKAFIAGADIKFFIDNIKNKTLHINQEFTAKGHRLLRRFETSPKLTIAILDGLSLGGGSELALSCQAIVATQNGSMGFPETGIGIYPGLGGMLRFERHVGPELAKYFVFTGKTIKATEALELGIVTKLTDPAHLEAAIREVVDNGPFDKYASREIPAKYNEYIKAFGDSNISKIVNREAPEGVDAEFAKKTGSILAKKAPIALRIANELIDAQSKVDIDAAIELELARLEEMFSTEDALTGLTTRPGKPIEFQNK